ncbi:MAG TPA: methyl-accepting chemotaxis protein [Acidobacteriaceae bacterium]|nr:methyl-accepting chemotaxis protein [Acidobacteriaceae bacterium]
MPASTVRVNVNNHETILPDNVFIYSRTDLKGRITEANPAFAEISGYTVEEMLGKPHNMVRHPDMPREAFADMWSNLQKGRPWQAIVKNRRSDGGFYWVIANASPIRENGQVVGFQSIRFKPSRDQIRAAEDAYRRIREGDRSLAVVDGRAVARRARWAELAMGCTTQLRLSMVLAVAAAVCGYGVLLGGAAYPFLRPLAETAFALSALAALAGFFFAERHLHRDLEATIGYLETILTTGNLKARFDLRREDCLGSIGRRLSLFVSWVEATVLSVGDAVVQVQAGTEDVLKGVLEIEKAAQSQSAASGSVAAAAAELDLTIREVSGHLQTTETTVGETGRQATAGASISQRAAAQIQDLSQAIRDAASEVEALGATSAEVGQIAGVIREIADQTNLLALNASIEAARAGAAGRGFAVVATEVRNLADRTMKATANIDSLIVKIKGDSDRAIGGMRNGAAQVADGVTLVQNAHATLNGINELMTEAVRRVTDIAHSSTQQTEAMNEITRNITQVAAMTEQNEATVRRTTQQMQALAPLVDRVQKAILQYHA